MTRLAVVVLGLLYAAVFLAPWLAPYPEHWADARFASAPPTPIYWRHPQTGALIWPSVPELTRTVYPERFSVQIVPKPGGRLFPLRLGQFLGEQNAQWHFIGVDSPGRLFLLGTDTNGRDWFSRLLYGGRVSLTVGFLSLLVAIPMALLIGGIAGFAGGWIDFLLMRLAEVFMAIPSLFLLLALAASLPAELSSTARFAWVTVILAFIGWPGLSRVIRGMVLSIKQQPFLDAGRVMGFSRLRLLIRHVLPQTLSYVIVAVSIGVPGYILAESGLSFLGLGIQQPDASWGNLLKEAQSLTNILQRPWMLAPGLLIAIAVLAYNILGDAVRDSADPATTGR